jgi:hypothetical protein
MDENHLKTPRILELEPSLSQRVLAQRLNLSLGKANFLLNYYDKGRLPQGGPL